MPGATEAPDDSDEDSYANVGTAFELLETPEDIQKAKKQKEKEQYVTDEQGRRRFHGAFTGGFSAGYFNTVGSKEGWTPASFTSSRSKKADMKQQRPEDFMDAEDLGEHGIAPREISAKEQFTDKRPGTKRPQPTTTTTTTTQPSVIPGEPPLQNLIVPVKSTIGAKLLSAMGWRAGQGVGPKEKRSSVRAAPKVYGCSFPEQDEDNGLECESTSTTEQFMFAPKDVKPWEFEPKDNVHGIGYSGMQEQSVLSTQQTSKALYGMSGQAFGTGALEEEEDEDIFAEESVATYHASIAQDGDAAMEMKFGWTGVDADSDTWNLSCFVKAKEPFLPAKRYLPPEIPRDFCLVHKFSSSANKELNKGPHPLTSHERANLIAANNDELPSVFALVSVEDRDRIKRVSQMAHQVTKGEMPLQEAHQRTQLVLDERLEKKLSESVAPSGKPPTVPPAGPAGHIAGRPSSTVSASPAGHTAGRPSSTVPTGPAGHTAGRPSSTVPTGPAGHTAGRPSSTVPTGPAGHTAGRPSSTVPTGPAGHTAGRPSSTVPAGSLPSPAELSRRGRSADPLGGIGAEDLKPFSADPSKQMRYEAFLAGQIEKGQNMTEWELQREREEFTRTARVHQPLATALMSKFTRGKEDQKEEEGDGEVESDAVQAAKVNMFGVLTRETLEWHPHKTLCKRFNIPEPYPRSEVVGVVTDEDRRKMRNRERTFVRESAEVEEAEDGSHGYGIRGSSQSGPQAISFQAAVEQLEENVDQKDYIQDKVVQEPEKSGDKEDDETERRHGNIETNQYDENKEEETEMIPRPSMDLFKAIFAEDSSCSEEEDLAGVDANSTSVPTSSAGVPSSSSISTSGGQAANADRAPVPQITITQAQRSTIKWQNLSLVANRVPEIPVDTVTMVTSSPVGVSPVQTQISLQNIKSISDRPPGGQTITSYGPALPPQGHVTSSISSDTDDRPQGQHRKENRTQYKEERTQHKEKRTQHKERRTQHKHKMEDHDRTKKEKSHRKKRHS